MRRLLFAGLACFASTSAFAVCNPTDHAENVKWCVQQTGNGICRCVQLNDPECAKGAFETCQTWPDKDKEQKIRDNKNACENQFPGITLKNAKLYSALCVE
jgi:hypothetical protein